MRDRAVGERCGAGRVIVIGLLLLVAGCAAGTGSDNSNSGDSRHSGFYGGISGGYSGLNDGGKGM
jgi:uncharacterized spore protein YtfJ